MLLLLVNDVPDIALYKEIIEPERIYINIMKEIIQEDIAEVFESFFKSSNVVDNMIGQFGGDDISQILEGTKSKKNNNSKKIKRLPAGIRRECKCYIEWNDKEDAKIIQKIEENNLNMEKSVDKRNTNRR